MSDNLRIYEAVRKVPPEAQKEIKGGRLSGMTDINPMWRIKALTEQFGPCGIGWTYEPVGREFREGSDGQVAVFQDILLRYKDGDKWSEPIPGTGGSMFIAKERSGLFTSDECIKMATTDAISVAAKALGIGADVYWNKDKTKYVKPEKADEEEPAEFVAQLEAENEFKGKWEAAGYKNGQLAPTFEKKYGVKLDDAPSSLIRKAIKDFDAKQKEKSE
ncbi:MAG: hypothetical protein PHO15_08255 [Eubacteriales bacterium]|nr:hypothetical protein [Eubacteriales bacterium]